MRLILFTLLSLKILNRTDNIARVIFLLFFENKNTTRQIVKNYLIEEDHSHTLSMCKMQGLEIRLFSKNFKMKNPISLELAILFLYSAVQKISKTFFFCF